MSGVYVGVASPDYNYEKMVQGLTVSQWLAFKNGTPSLNEYWLKHPDVTQAEFKPGWLHHELTMDSVEAEVWMACGIKLTFSRLKGLASDSRDLPKVCYQIAVANVGLLQIQKVDVMEDACTDELQKWLDRGWRILAVCPPNSTRRPDYVMGHFEKEGHY